MTTVRARGGVAREQDARDLEKLYRRHPVREAAIMTRLRGQRKNLDALHAADLAEDSATDVTDQNHIGGSRAVFGLAAAAHVTGRDVILDLGCGLGGSARLLADRFGCRVDGLDISRQRVREARRLTALVGLSDLVHVARADMLRVQVPRARYDVIWGQGAWNHIVDKPRLIRRWRRALNRRGTFAFEDVYLKRAASNAAERRLIDRLERDWHATIVSRDEWERIFREAGARSIAGRDLTGAMIVGYRRASVTVRRARTPTPALERRAWRNAIRAARAGLIGYLRLCAMM